MERIGVFICWCGSNIAGTVDVDQLVEWLYELPGVDHAQNYMYMCSDPGQDLIKNAIQEKGLNRVVVASCSPRMHEKTFRAACQRAGLNPYRAFHMVCVREHVSWVSDDRVIATQKAKKLVSAAVRRVRHHDSLESRQMGVRQTALVVGAGIAGIEAALKLADAGKQDDLEGLPHTD